MDEAEAGQGTPAGAGATAEPQAEDRPLDAEKLLRIASLASQVLEEARHLDQNDENASRSLASLHDRVTTQLYEALPNTLVKELEAMDLDQPFAEGAATGQEVRIAYAGLIGWLGGLLQGLQAAMQMAHMQALQQARQVPAMPPPGPPSATGQYL